VRLEEARLVKRQPHSQHGRVLTTVLTPEGTKLVRSCRGDVERIEQQMLAPSRRQIVNNSLPSYERVRRRSAPTPQAVGLQEQDNGVSDSRGSHGAGVAGDTDDADALTLRRADRVTAAEYRTLLAAVGWRPVAQPDAALAAALGRSWNVTIRTPDGALIGLARVLDDGVLYASLWDILVLPERQRRGIGRALLAAVLAQTAGRRLLSLIATPAGEALYRSAGFAETDGRSTALFRRDPEPG
jgi:GNAT superfamily N-acetyltransferase